MSVPSKAVVAADHAGFQLKEAVKAHLESRGIEVTDAGTFSEESVDYPAVIRKGCEVVLRDGVPGFVFGGSGNGEAMAANKMRGIRAALCWSEDIARAARSHNDANVCSMGGRFTDKETALRIVDAFLETPFEGGRHERRINDLDTPMQ